jgi:hypothetical protein
MAMAAPMTTRSAAAVKISSALVAAMMWNSGRSR